MLKQQMSLLIRYFTFGLPAHLDMTCCLNSHESYTERNVCSPELAVGLCILEACVCTTCTVIAASHFFRLPNLFSLM
ncbi:unnamed protein product [Sphagnum balticum]